MHNKPMKLDLSNFFTDERKCSLILLDVSWKNIKNLQDHIQNLFHLNGISLLTGDGSYLPPKESIEVLRNADCLKAFQFQIPIEDHTIVEMASTSTRKSTKRRKNHSSDLELASSTPNNAKRSRNQLDQPCSILATTEKQSPKLETKKKRSRKVEAKEDLKNDADTLEEDLSNKENTLEIATTEQESPLVSTKNLQSDLSHKKVVMEPPTPRCPEVVLRCALLEINLNTPRVFKLPRQESPVKILENILIPAIPFGTLEPKEIEPIRELKDIEPIRELKEIEPTRDVAKKSESEDQTPDLETSKETQINEIESTEKQEEAIEEANTANVVLNSDSEDDVMVLEDSDSDVQPVASVGSRKTETTDVISDLLQYGVKLKNLPSKGDTIVFKLPKIKGSPKSGLTEFLAGSCCYVHRRTKVITINLISYPKHLLHLLRQYKSNLDESEADVPVLNVNINDLIEASICVATVD
ncbi:uncharacterized protein Dwil_GK22926 [Drosophila willistoni]|uniref:Coilin N-terminal domain-containing protein n=1 Tax=Drosophila willistoni TaxID=7260 RepID=B4NN99_DROWI|nr:coilin [Drosophila willistoni]EDW85838.1 uncharacterized protein Dwil_GK22926 [Drosophila willistoni]